MAAHAFLPHAPMDEPAEMGQQPPLIGESQSDTSPRRPSTGSTASSDPTGSTVSSAPEIIGSKQEIKQKIEAELQAQRDEVHIRGAHVAVRAEIANLAAQDIRDAENDKKAAYALFEKALGVQMKHLMAASACFGLAQALPKIMFLWIIVGCELDLYGFLMSISSYWSLDVLPLRILLITGPAGYFIAVAMFLYYSNFIDDNEVRKVSHITVNEFRPTTQSDRDLEAANTRLPVNTIDTKEPIQLTFYHFIPIVRYYLIIKDQNPSDVEGLFRVNSLSSFTLGVSQICGILFFLNSGEPLDIFVKVNIASQIINWTITLMYFATSISNRMKASFKVDLLLYNSTAGLRKEYESYLNCVQQAASEGVGKNDIKKFHDSLNFEISEFVKQDVDLSVFSMEEKYLMRQAIRKRMYTTYLKIK